MTNNEIIDVLNEQIKIYVNAIKEDYKDYIKKGRLNELNAMSDFKNVIHVQNTNTVSLFVNNNEYYFPLDAKKVFNIMKFVPGYGSNKNHKTYSNETIINNDNTFSDYIKHVFLSGEKLEDYYLDNLLHETTHFCGIDGSTALREGFAELKTRQIAKKHNFRTSACGYPKETNLACELEKIFGEIIGNKIAFARNNHEIVEILHNEIGFKAADLYLDINEMIEKEFQDKYYKYNYPGIFGPIKKTKNYDKLDYSKAYDMIKNYDKINDYKFNRSFGKITDNDPKLTKLKENYAKNHNILNDEDVKEDTKYKLNI